MGANHSTQVLAVCAQTAGLPLIVSINENAEAKAAKPSYLALLGEDGKKIVLKKPKRCRIANDVIQQHWEEFKTTGDPALIIEDLSPVAYISDLRAALEESMEKSVVYKAIDFTGDIASVIWLMSAPDQTGRFGIASPAKARKTIQSANLNSLQRLYSNLHDDIVKGLKIADGVIDLTKLIVDTILADSK